MTVILLDSYFCATRLSVTLRLTQRNHRRVRLSPRCLDDPPIPIAPVTASATSRSAGRSHTEVRRRAVSNDAMTTTTNPVVAATTSAAVSEASSVTRATMGPVRCEHRR
jgi:hypothetical protein